MMLAEQIRNKLINDKQFAFLREEAVNRTERYMKEGLPQLTFSLFRLFECSGDREQYQRVYFERRGTLTALMLTCLTSDNPAHREALENVIWEICNEYTWCLPAHLPAGCSVGSPHTVDLFAAETAHMLAEIISLSEDKLSENIQLRVRMEVEKRVFEPIFTNDQLLHWETVEHNWASVCAGAVGMAAMLLVKDKDRLECMLLRMKAAMECFLSGYGEDGGCAEGVGYWEYGFGFFVYFADMLREFTEGAMDLLDCEKVKAIAAFPEAVYLSEGVFVNYSDSSEKMVLQPGLLGYLGRRFGVCASIMSSTIPRIQDDPCYRWAHIIRNIAWAENPISDTGKTTGSQGLTHLKNLSWFVDRREIGKHVTAFSTKAGHNDEPHNHNDLGHFIIHAGGKNLLCDLGSGLYTRDYFGEGRYSILNNSSAGHSVPVMNGSEQAAGKSFHADVLNVQETERGTSVELDLTHAYPMESGLRAFVRSFKWECGIGAEPSVLYLEDKIQFANAEAVMVEERFISRICPDTTRGTIIWEESRTRLSLHYDSIRFQVEVESIEQLDHAGDLDVVYVTKLRRTKNDLESVEKFRFDLRYLQ